MEQDLAFSRDGRYAYYSNVAGTPYDGKQPADIDPKFPQGRVYRHDLTVAGADPEPFFDLKLPDWERTKYWMPSAWDKKTAAGGIDVDAHHRPRRTGEGRRRGRNAAQGPQSAHPRLLNNCHDATPEPTP